jgi:anti-sigma factor RsiW
MTGRIIALDGERHGEVQALLPWYLAGGLSEAEQAMVRQHLGACAECQAELMSERRLAAEVAAAPIAPAPEVERGWAAISERHER